LNVVDAFASRSRRYRAWFPPYVAARAAGSYRCEGISEVVEGVDAELARVLVEDARVALEAPARAPAARDAKEGAVTACIVSQLLWLVQAL
jgi:predicted dithiol-disulfide oxidoreductase (DUF899 family)